MNKNIMAEIYDNNVMYQPIYTINTINNSVQNNYKNIIIDCIEHNNCKQGHKLHWDFAYMM